MTAFARHPDLRLSTIDDNAVVLHLGSRQYFSVNETGATILNALEEPRTLPEIVARLTDEFDVTPADAERTTRAFLDECIEAGLLITGER